MEELLKKVLDAVGKTEAEFNQEVDRLKLETEQQQKLESLKQQQAATSELLLEFMEAMTGGM